MSEKTNKQNYIERKVHKHRKGIAAVMGLAALAGTVEVTEALSSPNHPDKGPKKVYVAKPYDTEWTIAEKAFPNSDVRPELDDLDSQLPKDEAHANHTVQPGDRFVLPGDSAIGTPEVTPK